MTTADHRRRYQELMEETLSPGGGLIVATFARRPADLLRFAGRPISAAELIAELGEGVSIVATKRELHVTPQGLEQPFTWIAGRRTGLDLPAEPD